jgi:hypothetical protein
MERESRNKKYSGNSDSDSLSFIEDIKLLIERERNKTQLTYDEYLFRLKRWWCGHYRRPYKDPMLNEYTFEELFYEYWDITSKDQEATPTDEIPQEEYDWAAEEEAKELAEEALRNQENDKIEPEADPAGDEAWAQQYIANTSENTLVNPSGDEADFGGDIDATF